MLDRETPEQKQIRLRKEMVERRRALITNIVQQYAPEGGGEGSFNKYANAVNLGVEGAAFNMLWDLIFFAFELLFNTPYLTQQHQYNEALKAEIASYKRGDPVQLIYRPGMEVFHVEKTTGEVDYTRPITGRDPTRFELYANGLRPQPSKEESLLIAYDRLAERLDPNALSAEQKLRLHGLIKEADKHMNSPDYAEQLAARQRAAANKQRIG